MIWLCIFLFTCLVNLQPTCGDVFRIGGIFDSMTDDQELVFGYAVEDINSNHSVRPRHRLQVKSEKVPAGDDLAVADTVCELLKEGVVGVFGPSGGTTSSTVQSICDTMEMPHIEVRSDTSQRRESCLLNLHPHPATLARVFVDMVRAWQWKGFTLLYETGSWLPRVADLLKLNDPKGYTVTVRQLDLGLGNYRPVLRRVKLSGDHNIVLDCSVEALPEVLKQAQQVGLMSDSHQFIITSLDMHTVDLEPFQYGGTNITGIRLLNPDDEFVQQTIAQWSSHEQRSGNQLSENLSPDKLRVQAALIYDAVHVLAAALRDLSSAFMLAPRALDCGVANRVDSWEHGYSIINYMKTSVLSGLTRTIKFDHQGFRSDFLLDVVELGPAGLRKVGEWNSTEGLNLTREHEIPQIRGDDGSLQNKTFIVLTAISPPYGMLKEASQKLSGNDRFEGFGIELIHEISLMLGFNYTFHIQEDGVYGTLNRETGEWNGMIKELLEWRADLLITDLTITSDREGAVDFTMPFMNLGITILYKKPSKQDPSLFSFMSPFSNDVWLLLGGSYLGVSLLLFFLGRISSAEWQNPFPCIEEPEKLFNQFSLKNSLWFTIGSLMQQGTEIAPIAASTRMVASIWWFFTLIIVSSYTANLAAFLTVESISSPIESAEDLANQNVIKYGAKRDGSTLSFFKDADYETYKRMYQFMQDNPDMLTGSNGEGQYRVEHEDYAYLMESTSIEYIQERYCDLTQIGGLLDDKGYGIAMRKNSPYRNLLSAAVLQLQEQGKLTAMKIRWWKEKRGGGACSGEKSDEGAPALKIANVGGVFVVLIIGSMSAIFVTIVEMLWETRSRAKRLKGGSMDGDGAEKLGLPNVGGVFVVLVVGCAAAILVTVIESLYTVARRSVQFKVPFREELMVELKFVAQCHGDTKPVRYVKGSGSIQDSGAESVESGNTDHSIRELDAAPNGQAFKTAPYGFVVDVKSPL